MDIFPLGSLVAVYFALFALATCALSARDLAQDRLDGVAPSPVGSRALLAQRARAGRTALLAFAVMGGLTASLALAVFARGL